MARYTLKAFCGPKMTERFEHRSKGKLAEILSHDRFYKAGHTGPFGEVQDHPDKFVVFDSYMEKLNTGNIYDTITFIKTLK